MYLLGHGGEQLVEPVRVVALHAVHLANVVVKLPLRGKY
jgi:hypothetical protein